MAKEKSKVVKVASRLEHELLAAVVIGAASPSIVDPKELSKVGRIVHASIIQLCKNGVEAPISLTTILTDCLSNRGAPEEDTRNFLRVVHEVSVSRDHRALLRIAKEKETVVGILNEASKQLASGDVAISKLREIAEKQQVASEKLVPMSETPSGDPPHGIDIDSLPTISKAARGVQGMWIIGGREGVGKSTLALQLAIELQQYGSLLYYDIDGTSEIWMRYRIEQAVGKENYHEASAGIYYRPAIETLDMDLANVPAPSTIVIDSIQTLPYQVTQRRSSIDQWLSRFKALTNKGYVVILVSELSREGEYKESSGINYAGTVNIELQDSEDGALLVIFKKNRHGPKKGHVSTLVRNAQYPYWWEEC